MDEKNRESRGRTHWWYALLVLPFLGLAWVPFFNHTEPRIAGIPFFYWYQLLWVIAGALVNAVVYFRSR